MTDPDWAALDAAWLPARRAGVLGNVTTEALIAHAAGYLPAACRVHDEFSGIDLGTGAGVPGVVLAALRPASIWTLVDGNERRAEYAQDAVRALNVSDRVTVRHARVEEIAHDADHRGSYDLVVARAFGPPAELAECALPLVGDGGRLVVSATTATRGQWESVVGLGIATLEEATGVEGSLFVSMSLRGPVDARWPRRPAARRRSPIV